MSKHGKEENLKVKKSSKKLSKQHSKERKHDKKHKRDRHHRRKSSPVQLSKFLNSDDAKYSSVSGKKIKLKLEKSQADKDAEINRAQLLAFLNSGAD